MSNAPAATVVFTTYNQPEWLERALLGFAAQSRLDFELIVADDGSGEDTRVTIERLRPQLPFALLHLWQPDRGFRKCAALNRAIGAAAADYLIFTDGDCIPRRDFVATHLRLRAPGRFLSGGYHKLPLSTSHAITAAEIASGRCFEVQWLRARGMPASRRDLKLSAGPRLGWLLDLLSPARASWNGHGASGWKQDLLAVNGFDERMCYGGEDREFGERLAHAGVRGKRIRHRTVALHLDHPRHYATAEGIAFNRRLRARTRRERLSWTEHGIARQPAPVPGWLPEGASAGP